MGSATREALAQARAALAARSGTADLVTGEQLFAAGRVVGDSAQLRAALADPAAAPQAKQAVVAKVFATFTDEARALLGDLVAARWSSAEDLLAGIEEIAIRVTARSAGADVDIVAETFVFGSAVTSDAELELAVGSKLGAPEARGDLVTRLLQGKTSPQTTAILSSLVQQPRGRRIGELLRRVTDVVADEAGVAVATVTAAAPISAEQVSRLETSLSGQYGRDIRINLVIDPTLLGGLRVQVGDDVIDGSVATKLHDLRLQLAG